MADLPPKTAAIANDIYDALDLVRAKYRPGAKLILVVMNPPIAGPADGDAVFGDGDFETAIETLRILGPKLREAQRG